jgi:hypothetical protein
LQKSLSLLALAVLAVLSFGGMLLRRSRRRARDCGMRERGS